MVTEHLRRMPVLHGELSVLNSLRGLDDSWHLFYSLEFLDRTNYDRQRELDFLLLHPTRGAVFVEVKGGQVRFSEGRVEQLLESGWRVQHLTDQLNGVRRVALEFMRRVTSDFIAARNLYCFPAVERPKVGLSQEIEDAGLFGSECNRLPELMERLCPAQSGRLSMAHLIEQLERCLTWDVGAALPSASVRPGIRKVTLSGIAGERHQFQTLDEIRVVVGERRRNLQRVWNQVSSGTTDLETAEGLDLSSRGDALTGLLRETDNALAATSIDIGVFGQVKRGKSTLVNALAGREVSAVGILPKTAVPVTIEWAPEESGAITFSDGRVEIVSLTAAVEATTQTERQRRQAAGLPLVERVLVRVPLQWLPAGVRVVDTPGLADPSLTDVYEEYTLTELSRLTAGIFVICYPPGPEASERKLLSSLGSHGLSKMFFVINMWSDKWRNVSDRREAKAYVEEMLRDVSNGRSFDRRDVKVFAANLGQARDCQDTGDKRGLADSGLPELKRALEDFISKDALTRIGSAAAARLLQGAAVIVATLNDREKALQSPERVQAMRRDVEASGARSSSALASIETRVAQRCDKLRSDMIGMAVQPFNSARTTISATSNRRDLARLESRLAIESATAASRLSQLMVQRSAEIVHEARQALIESIANSRWSFRESVALDALQGLDFSQSAIAPERGPTDYTREGRGLGGLLGAVLGGGSGIALAATGPIGLVIGGLLGLALGDAVGLLASDPGNGKEASPHEIARLLTIVAEAERKSLDGVTKVVDTFARQIGASLRAQRESLLSDTRRELQVLERLLGDSSGKARALRALAEARSEVKAITG